MGHVQLKQGPAQLGDPPGIQPARIWPPEVVPARGPAQETNVEHNQHLGLLVVGQNAPCKLVRDRQGSRWGHTWAHSTQDSSQSVQ